MLVASTILMFWRHNSLDKMERKILPESSSEPKAKVPKVDPAFRDCEYKRKCNRLVWVDLEMTGLDLETDHIIEMACIITDSQLNVIAEAPDLIIHQSDEVMNAMGEWCTQHHGQSGLTEAVEKSEISVKEAERHMVEFIKEHVPPGKCPLAGNSVHADKDFLRIHMPMFMDHLHYRIVDVSSIKELCRRWYQEVYENAPKKKLTHRALDDIKESIDELKYYRKHIFKTGQPRAQPKI